MCKSLVAFLTLLALTFSAATWAGPIEEVAEVAKPRQQAFTQGNIEAFTAAFADNAVLQSSFSPFRIEGKDAIRAYVAQLFQIYPKRWSAPRQPTARAYGDDLVVQNTYNVIHVIDEKGEPMTYNTRSNTIWKKMDGRWQIIDTHVSRLPGSR
jgi:uncharacterized protein (TIGR02246 family)